MRNQCEMSRDKNGENEKNEKKIKEKMKNGGTPLNVNVFVSLPQNRSAHFRLALFLQLNKKRN